MPSVSEKQRKAAGAALRAKRTGNSAKLFGAAKQMFHSMTAEELRKFARKPLKKKHKKKK